MVHLSNKINDVCTWCHEINISLFLYKARALMAFNAKPNTGRTTCITT